MFDYARLDVDLLASNPTEKASFQLYWSKERGDFGVLRCCDREMTHRFVRDIVFLNGALPVDAEWCPYHCPEQPYSFVKPKLYEIAVDVAAALGVSLLNTEEAKRMLRDRGVDIHPRRLCTPVYDVTNSATFYDRRDIAIAVRGHKKKPCSYCRKPVGMARQVEYGPYSHYRVTPFTCDARYRRFFLKKEWTEFRRMVKKYTGKVIRGQLLPLRTVCFDRLDDQYGTREPSGGCLMAFEKDYARMKLTRMREREEMENAREALVAAKKLLKDLEQGKDLAALVITAKKGEDDGSRARKEEQERRIGAP